MNIATILLVIGIIIILLMCAYLGRLVWQLNQQKKALQQARLARSQRLTESITIIANAMLSGECNHSEGVIRLKMLLDALGKIKLNAYPAMYELYLVVMDMPILEQRKQLIKKERMRLDLTRESAEAKLESQIKLELPQLLEIIK